MPISSQAAGTLVTAAVTGAALLVGGFLPDPNVVTLVLGLGINIGSSLLESVLISAGARLAAPWLAQPGIQAAIRRAWASAVAQLERQYRKTPHYRLGANRDQSDGIFQALSSAADH